MPIGGIYMATTIYRSQVGIDRFLVNHLNSSNQLEPIKGFRNNISARFDALVKTNEGLIKGTYATVAFLIDKVVETIFRTNWRSDLWKDVAKTQFSSAWLCAKGAVLSPDKALDNAATTVSYRNPYRAYLTTYEVDVYPAGTQKLSWGTKYDPLTSTWREKMRIAGPFPKLPAAPASTASPKTA